MANTNHKPMDVLNFINITPATYRPVEMSQFSPIVPLQNSDTLLQQNVIDLPTTVNQEESSSESAPPKRRGRPSNASKAKTKPKSSPKRQKSQEFTDKSVCPVCGEKLTKATWDEHVKMELAKIESTKDITPTSIDSLELLVPETQQRARRGAAVHARKKVQNLIDQDDENLDIPSASPALQVLKTVRNNRAKRASEKRNSPASASIAATTTTRTSSTNGILCPICSQSFQTDFDINSHIDTCLSAPKRSLRTRKTRKPAEQEEEDEEEEPDQEDDLSYDEGVETYTWGGQTRVRTCTLLQEGYTGFDGEKLKKTTKDEEDAELDIEDNDSAKFGNAQYSELDLITMEDEENKALRERVIETEVHPEKPPTSPSHHYSNVPQEAEEEEEAVPETSNSVIIESLKAKIREQNKLLASSYKCLICLDQYQVPLVSINCWHVHCEKCWLASLGAKKLCPQCKAITSPGDLRKIFM